MAIRTWPHAWKLAVATVCFGAFMGQLDASVVTLTYRPVEKQFGVGPAAVQWVSLAYLLTLVALLAPLGRRSDQRGRKLSYLHGFLIFTTGSALCGLAPDLPVLIGARVLQAVGAALLQANSVALVAGVAPRKDLRGALGIQAAAQALGLALGPTAGGLIVTTIGWRWVYAMNVPVGVVALAAGVLFLPRSTSKAPTRPTDWTGSALLAGVAGIVLLMLSSLGGLDLPAPALVGLAGAVVAGAYLLRRRPGPSSLAALSPLQLARPAPARPALARPAVTRRGLILSLAGALVGYLVLFGPLVLVPAVLEGRGVSALDAGLVLTALPAGFAVAATLINAVTRRDRSDHRRTLQGLAVAGAGLVAMLIVPLDPAWLAGLLGVVGVGLGIFTPANNASFMRSVPPEAAATAGGLLNMSRGFGTALGIAAVTLGTHLGGARTAVGFLAAAAGIGLLASWQTDRRGPRP